MFLDMKFSGIIMLEYIYQYYLHDTRPITKQPLENAKSGSGLDPRISSPPDISLN